MPFIVRFNTESRVASEGIISIETGPPAADVPVPAVPETLFTLFAEVSVSSVSEGFSAEQETRKQRENIIKIKI